MAAKTAVSCESLKQTQKLKEKLRAGGKGMKKGKTQGSSKYVVELRQRFQQSCLDEWSTDEYSDENDSGLEEDVEPCGETGKESEISVAVGSQHTYAPMIRLEDQMNNESLEMLQQIFQEADEDGGGGLDLDEFRQAMIKTMAGRGEIPDDNQLSIIFMKVDANCDGTVDWEEFCSYMLMENQLKDVMTSVDREMEFPYPAREIPSCHRDTIHRITYYPKMTHGGDDPSDSMGGRYLTVSKDGILHFWSMDLHNLRSHTLLEGKSSSTQRTMWVTDCVVLPNAKKVAVSSADREIVFYDCSANSFEKQFVLCGLEYCVVTMDYWFNPHKLNESVLLFGDAGGSVRCLKFSAAVTNLFDLSLGQAIPSVNCRRVSLAEITLGRHANVEAMQFNELHEDWVRKVRYYPTLQCFISCASSSNNSMYLGDLNRKKTRSMFHTRKGINSFDYCKEWNVIVTGGLDHHLRLWNPYVPAKPTSILKGHSACITHILINSEKGEIISAAQDKLIKIWDMRDLCCVQTVPTRSLLPGPHPISSLYYSTKLHCILVGTNQLSVLEGKNEEASEEHDVTSHTKPLCGALYNDLFDQVVTCCHDSVVCVWSLENGEKIIQFANAHGDSEITAMTFDQSKRRLITGARDGSVKLWNFNNGCCLRAIEPLDDEEITGIVTFKQSIVVVGWSKKLIVYKDYREEEEDVPRIWPAHHKDDILSISFYSPNLVATSCYNGDLKVWNLDTGHTLCVLNANNFDIPVTSKPVIPLELKRRVSENNAVLSAVLADLTQHRRESTIDPRRLSGYKSALGKSSILKDPSLYALSKRARSICPVFDKIEVKDSDYDSVVDKVLFLQKRENHRDTATLITGESGGVVRAWSIFGGGLLGQFVAGHTERESITALTTDENNTMLITGDTMGYVRVWDITEYCINKPEHSKTVSNRLKESRVSFLPPLVEKDSTNFVLQEGVPIKPPQPNREINLVPPPLAFKFRAHLCCVTCLDFIQKKKLLVTSSTDGSVRLWTYQGKYIGTFGQRSLWNLGRAIKAFKKIPHDIQRVASPDTMASLGTSGSQKWRVARHILRITRLGMQLASKAKNLDTEAETVTINIEESLKNVLGKHYHPRKRHRSLPSLQKPQFNQNQVVVYSSLPYKDMDVVVEPRVPSTLAHHGHKASSATLGDTNKNTRKSHAPTPSGTPFKQGFRRPASRESARKHVKVNKSPECLS